MLQSPIQRRDQYPSHQTLFGREREQRILRECLRNSLSHRGGLALIGGEAGIGKSSLVRALAQEAEAEGAAVSSSSCYDLAVTPPYGPWMELFSSFDTGDRAPPRVGASIEHRSERSASPDALFAEALDFVVDSASQQPLVLILEDLQWTDAASLDLLRYVARQIAEVPVIFIATYRDTELHRRHPLYQVLPSLVRESHATRINLRPLDDEAVRLLTRQRYELSATDESRLVEYLQDRAEGNPFFISELLRTLEEEGIIALSAGGWVVGDLGQIMLPPLVQQVIEGRLARLDRHSRNLLAVASVIGQTIPLDIWRVVSAADADELSSAIKSAIEHHLLEELPAPTSLRFTHALVREALYYEVELPQRCELHQAVGEALAQQPSPDPDAVAYHLREAGHVAAPEWLMAAGERAQRLYAWRAAAERFEEVLPFLESSSTTARARGWLLYRVGLLLRYADPSRGISRLSEAEQAAHETGDEHLGAYARADRGLIRCLVGDVRRGLAEMQAGVATLDALPAMEFTRSDTKSGTPNSKVSIESIQQGAFDLIGSSTEMNIRQGALIFWLAWAGRYAEAIAIGEPYISNRADPDARIQDSLGDALAGLGHAYAALGRPDEALEAFTRARDTYQSIDHHFKVGNTAIYELSEAFLPYRADRVLARQWLADQAEAG